MKFRRDRGPPRDQLEYLHRKQNGLCYICKQPADLTITAGPDAPNRFRVGSSFGRKGRVRPRVMVHRKCADERSNAIQNSIPVEARREASGAFPLSAADMADALYRHGHGEKIET